MFPMEFSMFCKNVRMCLWTSIANTPVSSRLQILTAHWEAQVHCTGTNCTSADTMYLIMLLATARGYSNHALQGWPMLGPMINQCWQWMQGRLNLPRQGHALVCKVWSVSLLADEGPLHQINHKKKLVSHTAGVILTCNIGVLNPIPKLWG